MSSSPFGSLQFTSVSHQELVLQWPRLLDAMERFRVLSDAGLMNGGPPFIVAVYDNVKGSNAQRSGSPSNTRWFLQPTTQEESLFFIVPYGTFSDIETTNEMVYDAPVYPLVGSRQDVTYRLMKQMREAYTIGLGGVAKRVTFSSAVIPGITYTSLRPGSVAYRVRHVVAGMNTARSVAVAGNDITVNLATTAGGDVDASETGSSVATSVNAHITAGQMVHAVGSPDVLAAVTYSSLTGGELLGGTVIPGSAANGTVWYTVINGGSGASQFRVKHVADVNSTLHITGRDSPNDWTLTLAADGKGAVTSTASDVADYINNTLNGVYFNASHQGNGLGLASTTVDFVGFSAGFVTSGAERPRAIPIYKRRGDRTPIAVVVASSLASRIVPGG